MTAREEPLLRVRDLVVTWPGARGGRRLVAVGGVDLDVFPGETVALVGESGCGKSSLARAVLQLRRPDRGSVCIRTPRGVRDLARLSGRALRRARRHLQVVFQDPYASLDPRMTVRDAVAEPLRSFGLVRGSRRQTRRVETLLERVGLDPSLSSRYPHELSGGQRQRVGIARALAPEPDLVILDEAVSALDVSLRAQVLNLLLDLRRDLGLSLLFITHDLAVVQVLAHRVAVMYLGCLVEVAPRAELFGSPRHPYTRALLDAVPVPDPAVQRARRFTPLPGDPPSPEALPPGCAFASRCPLVEERCRTERPALRELVPGVDAACHLAAP